MNKRITQELAKELSNLICAPKEEANKKLKNKLMDDILKLYKNTIPVKIMNTFKEYPDYFQQRRSFYYCFEISFSLKAPCNDWHQIDAEYFEGKQKESVKEMCQNYLNQIKIINQKRNELYNAILSFRTFNALKENFPEAYKLIPKRYLEITGVNLPIKNIDHLKAFAKEKPSAI